MDIKCTCERCYCQMLTQEIEAMINHYTWIDTFHILNERNIKRAKPRDRGQSGGGEKPRTKRGKVEQIKNKSDKQLLENDSASASCCELSSTSGTVYVATRNKANLVDL